MEVNHSLLGDKHVEGLFVCHLTPFFFFEKPKTVRVVALKMVVMKKENSVEWTTHGCEASVFGWPSWSQKHNTYQITSSRLQVPSLLDEA